MTPVRPRVAAWSLGLWMFAVLAVAAGAAAAALADRALAATAAVVFGVVPSAGAVVARHVPRNPVGWLLLGGGTLGAVNTAAPLLARVGLDHGASGWWVHLAAWVSAWAWIPTLMASLLLLVFLFPDGRPVSPRLRPAVAVGVAATAVCAGGVAVAAWSIGAAELVADGNPAPTGWHRAVYLVAMVALVVCLLDVVVAVASVVVRWRRADADTRQQLKWVFAALGTVVATTLLVSFVEVGELTNLLMTSAIATVAVAVGVAVRRYRLYAIDRIVSRTVTYACVVAALAALYAGLLAALAAVLPAGVGQVGVAAATLAVAVVALPLTRRVRRVVDARFNRRRLDRARIVQRFADGLRRDPATVSISDELVDVVGRVLEPAHTTVWLVPR